jgi:hypothetical protein
MDETDNNTQMGDPANFSTVWKTPADEFFQ